IVHKPLYHREVQGMPDRTFAISATRDFPYFRKVWKKVVTILIAAAFLPLVLVGGGMYFYMARTIKNKTMEALQTEAVSHQKTIDSFLTERTMDLKLISENNILSKMISPGTIEQVLSSLQSQLPCFQDLGIIGSNGDHLAYTGPHDLADKNYRDAFWFKAVMVKDIYISDVFTGFRNEPHFIIAVKRNEGKNVWILRATILSGLFDNIVTRVAGNRKGDAYLINSKGAFQTNPRHGGKLMMKSQVSPPGPFKGVQVDDKGSSIILTTWLETIPWLCVVSVDKRDIFEVSRKVKIISLFIVLLAGFLMILAILLTTDSLVSMLEEKRKKKHRLDSRLRRTAFLASSMKLARGVFSDLNDILSNIHVTATLMKEQTGPADSGETDSLAKQIFSESIRGKNLIDSFSRYIAPKDPVIMDVNIHMILNRMIGFLQTSLIEKNIDLITRFHDGSSFVRSDVAVLRQVFLNLLLNASAVVGTNGSICVSTFAKENSVMVLIADDGPGLETADMEQIFDLQQLSKRGDWGFGLAISRFILERIGGKISVRNGEKYGVVFEVQVPEAFIGTFLNSELMISD
ncbi:sensor histidine kinase, partial [Desulfobacula sp.]|uniref:sensor histidine kinase n=1 Tax=Desulfobacula sp. TaxID=2593537 RepID=UPI00262889CF